MSIQPIDEQLGRSLVQRLVDAETTSNADIVWSYDRFSSLDKLTDLPRIVVSPFNVEYSREGRQPITTRNVQLLMTFLVKQPPNRDAYWFGKNLTQWDELLLTAGADTYVDEIEITERYQIDEMQNHACMICQAVLNMNFN